MTTFDLYDMSEPADVPVRLGIAARLLGWTQAAYRRHQERKTFALLAGKDAHLLRDMGLEPSSIYGALDGTISEVHGDKWRGFDH